MPLNDNNILINKEEKKQSEIYTLTVRYYCLQVLLLNSKRERGRYFFI